VNAWIVGYHRTQREFVAEGWDAVIGTVPGIIVTPTPPNMVLSSPRISVEITGDHDAVENLRQVLGPPFTVQSLDSCPVQVPNRPPLA